MTRDDFALRLQDRLWPFFPDLEPDAAQNVLAAIAETIADADEYAAREVDTYARMSPEARSGETRRPARPVLRVLGDVS